MLRGDVVTHQQGPCGLFHDPLDDVSTVPDLSPAQLEVVELLELNGERRPRPRLSVHELGRVDAVIAWAEARSVSRTSGVPFPRSPA